jgi:aryl-alcohol dehydrogenase-like predicted oxidoreductase
MIYRKFGQLNLSALTFGTATFAAGKLNPNANSEAGINTLSLALELGINVIHSSRDMNTWWAVRKAMKGNPHRHQIHHLVKIRLNSENTISQNFRQEVETALVELETDHLSFVQIAAKDLFRDIAALTKIAMELKDEGKIGLLLPMADNIDEMKMIIKSENSFQGAVAYFSLSKLWVTNLLEDMRVKNISLFALSPLNRGTLTDFYASVTKTDVSLDRIVEAKNTVSDQFCLESFALRFVLSSISVCSAIIGTGNTSHLMAMTNAVEPLQPEQFNHIIELLDQMGKENDHARH